VPDLFDRFTDPFTGNEVCLLCEGTLTGDRAAQRLPGGHVRCPNCKPARLPESIPKIDWSAGFLTHLMKLVDEDPPGRPQRQLWTRRVPAPPERYRLPEGAKPRVGRDDIARTRRYPMPLYYDTGRVPDAVLFRIEEAERFRVGWIRHDINSHSGRPCDGSCRPKGRRRGRGSGSGDP
jgi:hypothetical protein